LITACLKGGMGNQMFQYSMGLAQAHRLGVPLQLGTDWYDGQSFRRYSLPLWEGVVQPSIKGVPPSVFEYGEPYDATIDGRVVDGDCISGYWQSEKYFAGIRQELLSIFRPRLPLTRRGLDLLEAIREEGPRSTFLSVRRTDYIGSRHEVPLMEFYPEACGMIARRIQDPHVFVFSDDPGWCKENLRLPYRLTVVDEIDMTTGDHLGREDEDLWMMSRCHNAVLANSSLSWWGAWLSPVPDGSRTVVAPKRWLADGSLESPDRIPERWTRA